MSDGTHTFFTKDDKFILMTRHAMPRNSEKHYAPMITYAMYDKLSLALEIDEFSVFSAGMLSFPTTRFEIVLDGAVSLDFLEFLVESPIPSELKLLIMERFV